jgi:cytochrome d ubiquinol oxidase subunit I
MIVALLLARIQFGLSLGVHFIFPALTLGLTLYVLIFETAFVITGRTIHRSISEFLVKLLSLVFTLGVATGVLLPFSFGANWAKFSIFSGQLFGTQLAIEAFTAFVVESIGVAIMLFGRGRVREGVYLIATAAVFLASHLSAFWIISANSWMQTPAGYAIRNGTVVLVDFWKAIFNPSAVVRFVHTTLAAWLTGTVAVAGIAAWRYRKGIAPDAAVKILSLAVPLFAVTAVSQLFVGHSQVMNVVRYQPVKDAAYEGMFSPQNGAPLYLFGIPDADHKTIHAAIAIPKLLSFLENFSFNSRVNGLAEYDQTAFPPVNVIFTTFHAMVGIGLILIGSGLVGLFLQLRRRLFTVDWFLRLLPFLIPLPLIANELGWIGAEMGRQPWVIYGLLRTQNAISPGVSGERVLITLIMLSIVYAVLLFAFIYFGARLVNSGPDSGSSAAERRP